MSEIITVADVRAAAPGKKEASVIDNMGKRWGIHPNEMGNYRQFGTYEITKFKTREFQSKIYYTIEEAKAVSSERTIIPTSFQPPASARPAANPYTPPNDDMRRMDIFVCGAFNNMMANPCTNPQELTTTGMAAFVNALKSVWKLSLGPQAQEVKSAGSSTAEFNDDIPF